MRIRLLFLGCLVALTSFSQKNIFPHSGTLIIIGGGSMPDTMYQTFAKLIGGKNQPVVYIPTATGDEEWIQQGKHLDKFIQQGFTQLKTLHTRDRKKAEGPELAAMIDRAKGVFLGGGDQEKLAEAYGGTAVHRALIALLNRGGVIMGTSAGATIMGSVLIGGDHRKTPHIPTQFTEGFSLMQSTAIDQHVLVRNRQFDLVPVLERMPGVFGMALDESTAAIVRQDSITVIGKSYMLVYDPTDWTKQQKEWGRVYRPFWMIASGKSYRLTR
jgi:cyanophycinase